MSTQGAEEKGADDAAATASTLRRAHYVTLLVIFALVLGTEIFARQVRSFQKVPLTVPGRAANVSGFSDNLALAPPAPPNPPPTLLLLGSSQSYSSSSTETNANGFGDQQGTLIDWIATDVGIPSAQYLRFASGSILPNEMMVAEAHIEAIGYHPRVVILPLIWTNIAIDRDYRPAFREALGSERVASLVDERLRLGGASEELLASFRTEATKAAASSRMDGPRPLGDLIDDRLTAWARPRVGIVGRREDLQAGFYERIVHQVAGRITPTTPATRPPNIPNLTYNLAMLRVFVGSLVKSNIAVLVYRAPQRTNVPVPVEVARSDEFLLPFMEDLTSLGAVVVDARGAVPDSMFGWTGPTKDFNHFVQDGHRSLAEAIVREGREHGVFTKLTSSAEPEGTQQ